MKLTHALNRIGQMLSYARLAYSLRDSFTLGVLGLARGHSFGDDDIMAWVGRSLFPLLRVRPKQFRGLSVCLDPQDTSQMVVADEFLHLNVYDLGKVPFVPDLILDCGAHIGMFSLLCRAQFERAQIKAFEPNEQNLPLLRMNVQRNSAEIEIIPAAVWTTNGEGWFEADSSCGGSLTGKISECSRRVSLVDLRRYLPTDSASKLLLKLDIEGAETEVLPAIVPMLPETTAVFIETHDGKNGWQHSCDALSSTGFGAEVVREHGKFIDGFALRTSKAEPSRPPTECADVTGSDLRKEWLK